jgi:hypothetical protein
VAPWPVCLTPTTVTMATWLVSFAALILRRAERMSPRRRCDRLHVAGHHHQRRDPHRPEPAGKRSQPTDAESLPAIEIAILNRPRLRRAALAVAAVLSGLALAACGGAGDSATVRAQLLNQIENSIRTDPGPFTVTPELVSCIAGRARSLPLANLRLLAQQRRLSGATENKDWSLVGPCLEKGPNLAAIRAVMIRSVGTSIGFTSVTTRCWFKEVPSSQLIRFLALYAKSRAAAAVLVRSSFLTYLGACLRHRSVLDAMRFILVSGFKREARADGDSPAFVGCTVAAFGRLTSAQVLRVVQPAGGRTYSDVQINAKLGITAHVNGCIRQRSG